MRKFLLSVFLFLALMFPAFVLAWDDCPYGEVDCEEPGQCPRYIDIDQDGLCDNSQLAPEDRVVDVEKTEAVLISEPEEIVDEHEDFISGKDLKTKTVAEIAEIYEISSYDYSHALREYIDYRVEPDTKFSLLHDNYELEPSIAKDIALSLRTGKEGEVINVIEKAEEVSSERESVYNFIPLSLIVIFLYALTWTLAKFKKIKLINHRKLWNWILLFVFLAAGISGILLVIRINYGIVMPGPFNILRMHVETGIVMTIISIFHIAWHWRYYFNFLIKKK